MNLTGITVLVVLLVLLSGLRIAREYQRAVVFRLGRYTGLRGPGLFWLIPLGVENETRIDLRVVTAPIEQQETITRDSVTVKVNAVLWYRVSDPQRGRSECGEFPRRRAAGRAHELAKRYRPARFGRSSESARSNQ